MIGTHDSYTYQKSKNFFAKFISIFWRTQKLTIQEQYNIGVRVFDVRVYRTKDNKWGTAHGFVHFDESFESLSKICEYFGHNFPGAYIRIYLEDKVKNNEEIKTLFLKEAELAFKSYEFMLWEIGTHFPWITYYRNSNFKFKLIEYCCHLFGWNTDKGFWYNIKNIDWSSFSIPSYAKKHNQKITQEMIDDKSTLYFYDYVGIYPKN